jgi:drug/metabolite transporter (DMT)-like permease
VPALSRPARGALAMVGAMATFVVNDAFVKLAAAHYPTGQLLALRGVVSISAALALVHVLGHGPQLRLLLTWPVALRGLTEAVVAFTFILALAHLPLANITAILQAASLIVVAMAAAFGIEQVGWRRWLAVLVGFVGVLLVVKPGLDGFNAYALVALASSLLVGVRDLLTRRIKADIPSPVISLGSTIMVSLFGLAMSVFTPWQPIVATPTLYLAIAGVLVALGNLFIVIAFRDGEVTVVSALRYSVLLFALVLGYLVWGDWPDRLAMLGAALIVASGLYALHRQNVRARQQAAA